ncbi:hypothetical protein [Labilibaculum antarcticum]|uniref:Uncharacterized protein n=1 Tax=Labilibaculum antarcticum TaxID=1717717 RepID=A0A1Y1CNB0_9BACT|nr:hypothetical protein [Labilibaculum antarcticum]BAX81906.1 hypothetical protein ALGA_3614 [Labilibaculum antarcticum]
MKTKNLILLIATIASLLSSCDNDKYSDFTTVPNDYFPLQIGDTWEYDDHIRKVTGTEKVNNIEYKVVTNKTYRADTLYYSYNNYYRLGSYGKVYQLYRDKSDEFLFLNFSRREGESWSYETADRDDQKWNVEVLPELNFTINNHIIKNCKSFFYNVPGCADEEHQITFAPGVGEIHSYSTAWGISQTIQKTKINGIIRQF